jgi:hypothetical protein
MANMLTLLRGLAQPERMEHSLPQELPFASLQQSISHQGNLQRVNCLLQRLEAGENISMAVVGGSVSAGTSMRVRADQSGLFHRKVRRLLW